MKKNKQLQQQRNAKKKKTEKSEQQVKMKYVNQNEKLANYLNDSLTWTKRKMNKHKSSNKKILYTQIKIGNLFFISVNIVLLQI